MKCLLAELVVSHNLLNTLPTWGPAFKVSLDIFINSFDGLNLKHGVYAEVLRFTNTTDAMNTENLDPDFQILGSRIPVVFTHKDGYIIVASQIGDNNNYFIGGHIPLKKKTWHKLEITQFSEDSKVFLFIYSFQHLSSKLNIFCLISLFSIMLRSRLMEKSKVKGWKIQNLFSSQM